MRLTKSSRGLIPETNCVITFDAKPFYVTFSTGFVEPFAYLLVHVYNVYLAVVSTVFNFTAVSDLD